MIQRLGSPILSNRGKVGETCNKDAILYIPCIGVIRIYIQYKALFAACTFLHGIDRPDRLPVSTKTTVTNSVPLRLFPLAVCFAFAQLPFEARTGSAWRKLVKQLCSTIH